MHVGLYVINVQLCAHSCACTLLCQSHMCYLQCTCFSRDPFILKGLPCIVVSLPTCLHEDAARCPGLRACDDPRNGLKRKRGPLQSLYERGFCQLVAKRGRPGEGADPRAT